MTREAISIVFIAAIENVSTIVLNTAVNDNRRDVYSNRFETRSRGLSAGILKIPQIHPTLWDFLQADCEFPSVEKQTVSGL